MMRIHIDSKLIEDGYVNKIKHPTDDLYIYNYTAKAQYENKWLEYPEIRLCRGLVLNSDNFIVARPFEKFHNIEEHSEKSIVGALPNYRSFEVYDKLDGSLGISYVHSGGVGIATRGSFSSDQAIWATKFLKTNHTLFTQDHPEDLTFLFEIIYKENRIVVDYEYEDLILLAVIDNSDGYEYKIFDPHIHLEGIRIINLYKNLGFKLVKKFDGINDYTKLKEIIKDDEEGFIVRFKSGYRLKIKGEEYKRLHRILTNVSTRSIWDYLKEGKPMDDLLERVPDEFYNWVKETKENFENNFKKIKEEYEIIFDSILNSKEIFSRKDFAINAINSNFPSILFAMYDNRPYDQIIWKILYPEYSKPFKKYNDV